MKRFTYFYWFIWVLVLNYHQSALAKSSYYRWQDSQGSWHFSDKHPLNTEANISKIAKRAVNRSKSSHVTANTLATKATKKSNVRPTSNTLTNQRLKQAEACNVLKQQREALQKKLRAGYKEPKGNTLRAQRRKLDHKIYHQC